MSVPDDFRRSTLGGARSPQPLGRDDAVDLDARSGLTGPPRGTRVADANLKKGPRRDKKKAPDKKTKSAGREITIVGTFKNPFKSRADEIEAMDKDRWEPSTDDFVAVGGDTKTVDNFLTIFGTILVAPERTASIAGFARVAASTYH